MLAGGVAATAALVVWAGYPASMVGVNGARISNLNPPTLAVVTFGIAQVGLALLLRPPLARWMRRPVAWAAVAMANLSAMTLFLWHQTAFLAVTMAGLLIGRLPGLHTAPAGALWVAERLAGCRSSPPRSPSCGSCSGGPSGRRGRAGPANRSAPRSQRASSGYPGRAEYHRGPDQARYWTRQGLPARWTQARNLVTGPARFTLAGWSAQGRTRS